MAKRDLLYSFAYVAVIICMMRLFWEDRELVHTAALPVGIVAVVSALYNLEKIAQNMRRNMKR